ncbi:MAG TPA: hypothetical protein VGE26_03430 [Sphingobacteriaceae bacterium]
MKQLITGLLLLFVCFGGYSQTDKPATITERFDKHRKANLQEKVFVHNDKSFYLAGEIMWFKIYNVDGTFHKPANLSKVCYLELVDASQKAVLQTKVDLNNGSGSGSFFLPLSLISGSYEIRAYTSWMKNSDAGYFFRKQVTIVNSLSAGNSANTGTAKDYDIDFFPEGGNLVEGMTSKMAFRAIDEEGRGIAFEGCIVDQRSDTVSRFRPLRFGIGSFPFTPRPGDTYKAVIRLPDGNTFVKELPAAHPEGYVMNLTDKGGYAEVSVQSAKVQADQEVFLFVHTRQQTVAAEKKALSNGQATFSISKDAFAPGISHLTLFNSAGIPVSERLYFRRPEPGVILDASPDQPVYARRKKVTIGMSAVDNRQTGHEADLSVAVYDGSASVGPAQGDIFSYLWLSSDLKGNIESPEYYVLHNSAESNEALDNLMLTHGWRRFSWEHILGSNRFSPKHLPEYQGHIISGRVIDKKTGAGVEDIITYLSVPGKRIQLYPSKSGPGGLVRYFTREFYGSNEIVVQTNTSQDSLYRIEISSPFSEPASGSKRTSFKAHSVPSEWLLTESVNMQVRNIYSGSQMKIFHHPEIDSSAFYASPDKKYMLDHFTRFNTMEEVLREYVAEVVVSRNRKDFNLWVPVSSNGSYQLNEPFLLLDGVPVFDRGNKIIGYDPAKVEKIEVVNRNYFFGPVAFNSIVNFTTYKGDLSGFEISPDATVLNYEGMQVKREFYSPQYDTPQESSSRIPDFRNVLYWSPEIKTDKSGKATISFYTSDQAGKYTVSINGITKDGQPLSKMVQFEVR